MELTSWCRVYYKIIDDTFFKRLDNTKYHLEFVKMEPSLDNIPTDYRVRVTHTTSTGEPGDPMGVVLAFSLRAKYGQTNKDLIEETKVRAELYIPEYVKTHLCEIKRT